MDNKQKLSVKQRTLLKNIDAVYANLERKLPKFSDFFLLVVMNDFGENVNLKQLYPNLYKQAEAIVNGIKRGATENPDNPKSKETNKLHKVYQHYLKTNMKYKPSK